MKFETMRISHFMFADLFLIQKFATMEAWSNDFSSLFNAILIV